MKAYVFPGQGSQFVGMGKDLYEQNALARELFDKANADAPANGYWLYDGVHPSAFGHRLIQEEWVKAFDKL